MRQLACAAQDCTLCMACVNACPKNTIVLQTDAAGFEKLVIAEERCIDCGLCEKVCKQRDAVKRNMPHVCYAAQAKDWEALKKSASGGAFQMLAQLVLEGGGVCYGCTMEKLEGQYRAYHIRVEKEAQLPRLLGSKYIPSIIGTTFRQAKQDLEAGKQVLFSGTPCQILGLKAYLGKEYENLLTADVICHGVTAAKLFNDYVKELERREKITVEGYAFRDKSVSWGTNYCYDYRKDKKGKALLCRHCPREESSYMHHYLKGNIFRENCYTCTLSASERVSDFTLGDYWEIEVEHPEFITKKKPHMVLRRGISCILANTEKAVAYGKRLEEKMLMYPVTLASIRKHNGNLNVPSRRGKKRQWVLETYEKEGYGPIEEAYRKTVGKKLPIYRMKNRLKSGLPDRVRIWIYRSPTLRRLVFHQ